jgi:hypothetical protein
MQSPVNSNGRQRNVCVTMRYESHTKLVSPGRDSLFATQSYWRAARDVPQAAFSASNPSIDAFDAVSSKLPWNAASMAWSRAISM